VRMHACPVCQREFVRSYELKLHMRKMHKGERVRLQIKLIKQWVTLLLFCFVGSGDGVGVYE
jgi:hypothetical protein